MEKNYWISAQEVADLLKISLSYAYRYCRTWNKELQASGFICKAGCVPRAFFEKKIYGFTGNDNKSA